MRPETPWWRLLLPVVLGVVVVLTIIVGGYLASAVHVTYVEGDAMALPDLMIPRTIRVLDHPYRVEVVTKEESLFRGADEHAVGSTHTTQEVIKIRSQEDLSTASAIETLLHEVLHAMFALHSFAPYLHGDDDEPLISALAPALMAVLRANPQLVECITLPLEEETAFTPEMTDVPDADEQD